MRINTFSCFVGLLLLSACSGSSKQSVQGYVEGENIYLASPYSGVLEHLGVIRGQLVRKGQFLFSLDAAPQSLALHEIEADLVRAKNTLKDLQLPRRMPEIQAIQAQIEQAKAQLRLAEIRVDRMRKLVEKNAIDKDSLDKALAEVEQERALKAQYEANFDLAQLGGRDEQIKAQQAQVDALEAKVHQARWQLEQKTRVAPEAGVVFDTYFREGEFVGDQQPVLSLLTPANTRLEFFVPVDVLATLRLGQPLTFLCDSCTKSRQAIVYYISPEAEYLPPLVYSRDNQDKLVFRVQASVAAPHDLKPGQPVTVTLP